MRSGRLKLFFALSSAVLLSALPAHGAGSALSGHWARPAKGSSKKMSVEKLRPESCAVCHPGQYSDWNGALHSRSVGPGLLAQLDHRKDPDTSVSCYFCHAPLVEQSEVVSTGEGFATNPAFDERLKATGVSCAACHLRSGAVLGPVPLPGRPHATPPHKTAKKEYFGASGFCAACHQLESGYELNGKLLVNTYREWEESVYAKRGVGCQSCHMPDRRHLFRGIHDPETAASAVEAVAQKKGPEGVVLLRLTNTGAGHYFPTYATPQVVIRGYLVRSDGSAVEGTLKEAIVGRRVSLDLTEELFDTRIPPLGSFEFVYEAVDKSGAARVIFEVWVYPDEFYNRFFKAALRGEDGSMDRVLLKKAEEATASSGYLLFKKEVGL